MSIGSHRSLAFALAALAVAGTAVPARARAEYPDKPVVAIVPFSPGGGNDILLRLVSKYANQHLGQTLVVENKPGAGGQIGWTALARSKPDGYTIGATSLPSMILIKALRPEAPFALDDFQYVANIQIDPIIWVVHKDSRFKTAKELVEYAKANAKKLNVAGDGPQSNVQLQHLVASKALGISTNFVSYSGSGPALTAALGEQVDFAASTLSAAMTHIEAGKLRPLVVFHGESIEVLPGTPTAKAAFGLGIPSIGTAVRGVAAPKATGPDKLAKLEAAFRKVCESPAFLAEVKSLGMIVKFSGAKESESLVKESLRLVEEYKDLLK